jgi:hypothetical protein
MTEESRTYTTTGPGRLQRGHEHVQGCEDALNRAAHHAYQIGFEPLTQAIRDAKEALKRAEDVRR